MTSDYATMIGAAPIVLNLPTALGKDGVAARLVDALVAAGSLPASRRDAAMDAIRGREHFGGSTALAGGIAIPHGYLDELDGVLTAIGIVPAGLDCHAADGSLSRIFILILDSRRQAAEHIRFLATICRKLLQPGTRENLIQSRNAAAVKAILTGQSAADASK